MASGGKLGGNILQSGASAASNALLLILVIAGARVLGDKSFGNFSFALAVASVFETLTDFGLGTLTVRSIARDRKLAPVYLPNILGWKLVLSAISMGLLAITVNLISRDPQAILASCIMGGAIVLRSYKATCVNFYQSYERFDLLLLTTYTERIFVLGFGLLSLLLMHSLIAFTVSFILARIPDIIFSLWLVNRNITRVGVRLDTGLMFRFQRAAMPFGVYMAATGTYSYIGTIVLRCLRPAAEVGWYGAGFRVYEGLRMFPFLLSLALLPRLSRLFIVNREKHEQVTLGIFRYLLLATIPLVACIGLLSPRLVSLIYGKEYISAVPLLYILIAASPFMFANIALNTVLISANREKTVVRIACTGLVMMLAANLLLVWWIGVNGAAYAVLASEIFVQILLQVHIRTQVFRIPVRNLLGRPALAAGISASAVYLWNHTGVYASILSFTAIYAALLLALNTFTAEDMNVLKSLLPERRN